ncbi:tetratricopeptide repeat protein [Alkalilimnicola ehrlichii]|nr:tetratricopeptide repeat protein [Alkalilimnicola ehrlichii]
MCRSFLLVLLGLMVAACASVPPQPEVSEDREVFEGRYELLAQELEIVELEDDDNPLSELYYHLLVAELSVQLDDAGQALDSYLAAMRMADDVRVAERAARLALYERRNNDGLEAAQRWLALAPASPEAHQAVGLFELRHGNRDAALEHFQVLLDDPLIGPEEALARLGVALSQEPDREAGLAVLETIVAERPAEAHAQYVLAQVAAQVGRTDVALLAAQRASLLEPEWRAPYLLNIRIQLQEGETKAALDLLEKVLANRPEDYELRLYYARTLLNMERTASALGQFELLLQERPRDPQILYGAALLAVELERVEQARRYLLRLINVGERLDDAYFYLGRLAEGEGDYNGAIRWYGEAGGDRLVEAQFRIALLLVERGEVRAARQRLARFRREHPEEALRAYVMEAELVRQVGQPDQALVLLSRALGEWPDAVELLYSRALVNVELDRLLAAERDLRAIIRQRPDHAHALNALGYTLVDRTERYQEGYELIRRAHALKPTNPAIMDSLGWAYYRLGDAAKALEYIEQAYQRHPDPEIAAHLAKILWALGEYEEALQVFSEAWEADPEHPALLRAQQFLSE